MRLTVALSASVLWLALPVVAAFWMSSNDRPGSPAWKRRWHGLKQSEIRPQQTGPTRPAGDSLAAADQALASIGDLAAFRSQADAWASSGASIAEELAQAEGDTKFIKELTNLRTSVARGPCGTCLPPDIARRYNAGLQELRAGFLQKDADQGRGSTVEIPTEVFRSRSGRRPRPLGSRAKKFDNAPERKPRLFDQPRILELAQGLDSDAERNRLRALLKQANLKSEVQVLGDMARMTKLVESGPSTGLLLARSVIGRGLEVRHRRASCRGGPISRRPVDKPRARVASQRRGTTPGGRVDSLLHGRTRVKPERGLDLAHLLQKAATS